MMIYNMINMAQFEREQISERVALGTHARAMRGLLNGGRPILGYDKHPDKPGSYVVNEIEADEVRKIFRHYLNTGSCAKTIQILDQEGIKPKLSGRYGKLKISDKWTCQTLVNLLRSPAYIGFHEVNKRHKSSDQSRLKPHQQYRLVKASWPPIISERDFNNAKMLLDEAYKLERTRLATAERNVYILSGIFRCSECGSPLVGQVAHGDLGTHPYYGHTKAHSNTDCAIHRIPAREAEDAVLDYVLNATQEAGYLAHIEDNIRQMRSVTSINVARERRSIREQIKSLEIKIENLLLIQNESRTAEGMANISNMFNRLSKEKAALEAHAVQLSSSQVSDKDIKESVQLIANRLSEFRRGFNRANPQMKKRLLRYLLKQVVVSEEGLHIFMQMAYGVEVPNHQIKLIRVEGASENSRPEFALARRASGEVSNLSVLSSDIDKLGDPGKIRTCDLLLRRQLLYPTELRDLNCLAHAK